MVAFLLTALLALSAACHASASSYADGMGSEADEFERTLPGRAGIMEAAMLESPLQSETQMQLKTKSSSNSIGSSALIGSFSSAMRDGSACTYNKNGVPQAPYCPGSKYNCVVTAMPNLQVQIYNGVCNSKHQKTSYCKFRNMPFAVGVQNIRSNPLCNTCDCKTYGSIPGANKAACMCDSLPPCYVDYSGKARGKFACPANQNMCVIMRPGGGGRDTQGKPVDMGQCVFSGIGALCATAGSNWGPKFYMKGVRGVPKANNRCVSCTCGASGRLTNCITKKGCKQP